MRRPTNTGLASLPTRHLRSLIRACTRQSSIGVGKKLQAAIITGGLAASADSFLHNCRLHSHAAHARPFYTQAISMKFPTRTKTPWTGPFSWAALATTECSNPGFVCSSRCEATTWHGLLVQCVCSAGQCSNWAARTLFRGEGGFGFWYQVLQCGHGYVCQVWPIGYGKTGV
ncbi:hypothetical protein PS2_044712 [Malus domestica]